MYVLVATIDLDSITTVTTVASHTQANTALLRLSFGTFSGQLLLPLSHRPALTFCLFRKQMV